MNISVEHNIKDVLRQLDHLQRDQLPFATSLAINNVTKRVQQEQRLELFRRFTIRRRQWAERNIKIMRFANKRDIPVHALIGVEAPGNKSRSDVLGKFEKGGTKKAHDGGRLAVPDEVRRGKTGVVPKGKRPKAFDLTLHGAGPEATVYKGKDRTFMIRRNDGKTGGIYQRTGRRGRKRKDGTRGKGAGRRLVSDLATRTTRDMNVRTLYRFTPQAHIDSRLKFEETAQGVISARFAATFEEAYQRAIDSGRSTVVGRRGGVEIIKATKEARRIARTDLTR